MLDDIITFKRLQSGLWQLVANGTERPVTIIRSGRWWHVQTADQRYSRLETQHPLRMRKMAEAQEIAKRAWAYLAATRELARHEALEFELRRLFRQARDLGITFPIAVGGTDTNPIPLWRQVAFVKARIEDKLKGI